MSLTQKTVSLDREKVKQFIIDNFDEFISLEIGNSESLARIEMYWRTVNLRKVLKNELSKDFEKSDITSGSCNR